MENTRYLVLTGIGITTLIATLDGEIRYYSGQFEANLNTQTGEPLMSLSTQLSKEAGHVSAGIYNPFEDSSGGHHGKETQWAYRSNPKDGIRTTTVINDVTIREEP